MTPDLLAERRVRSAELALDAARARALAADETIAELAGEVQRLSAEPAALSAELAGERRARIGAEQAAFAERAARAEVERELERLAAERSTPLIFERELDAAHARVAQLEAELEVVRRRAADLHQAATVAVTGAWRELTDLRRRAERALAAPEPPPSAESHPDAPAGMPAPVVVPEALDAALIRLRAAAPAGGPARELEATARDGLGWLRRVLTR